MSGSKVKPGTGNPSEISRQQQQQQDTDGKPKTVSKDGNESIPPLSKRPSDTGHNDSGYDTNGHQSSDWRDNSSDSADSFGKTKDSQSKPSSRGNAIGNGKENRNTLVTRKLKNEVEGSQDNNAGKTVNNGSIHDEAAINRKPLVNGNVEPSVSGNPSAANRKERAKTARHGSRTLPASKIPATARQPLEDEPVTSFHQNEADLDFASKSRSVGDSTGSIRSKASDGTAGDKKVSFKDECPPERPPVAKSDATSKNSHLKVPQSSENPGGKKASAMSHPNSSRSSRDQNGGGNDNSDVHTPPSNYAENHLSSRFDDTGPSSVRESPRSDGEMTTLWRKFPSEGRSPKSGGPDGRDYDALSLESVRSARLSSRDDLNYTPTGRKFTRKLTKSKFGSSTTLSSNNESEDSDDVFNVVLRVRPLNGQEKVRRDSFVVDFPGDGQVAVSNTGTNRNFQFNVVFEPDAEQEDLFENSGIKKLVENALNGYTCTAFAFGQTGSGKTHTMTGPPAQFHQEGVTPDPKMYGLMQRSFKYMFQMLKRQGSGKTVKASYLEIYNEQVIDLLNNSHRRYLAVRWSKNKGFYVENLFTVECETIDDLMAVLEEGLRNRQTGSHGLNEFSSRSHSVLTVTIDSETQAEPEDDNLYVTKRGKLSFVDLAGSEKVKDSSTHGGGGMLESNSINKSLLVLGNCISHLGDSKRRQGHIPYRDSKLTKLLADSLGGNGITLMIACITPSSSNITETMNTLRYASRAKKIKTRPTVKMDPREKLIVALKKEIKILRNENHYLRQQLDFPAKPKGQLQKENDEKFMKFMKETQQKESGLYEMLQEYMVENETLRAENTEMQAVKDNTRRDQQQLHRENERLSKRVEELERIISEHPNTWALLDNHRRTDGYGQHDLSPRGSPVHMAYHLNSGHKPSVRPTDLPVPSGNRGKVGSPPHGQPKKPPHRLQDHVTRPAPRPIDYIEDGYHGNGYMSPRQASLSSVKQGVVSPRQIDRKASQISQISQTDAIRANNEKLKKDLLQLEGEIHQHARIAQSSQGITKFMR